MGTVFSTQYCVLIYKIIKINIRLYLSVSVKTTTMSLLKVVSSKKVTRNNITARCTVYFLFSPTHVWGDKKIPEKKIQESLGSFAVYSLLLTHNC